MKNFFSKENLFEIKKFLSKDHLMIFPTETIFAIACNAHSKIAVENLYNAKKREKIKSLSIFCPKIDIEKYAHIEFDWQKKIIEKFMPGEVTFLFKIKDLKLKNSCISSNEKIGIRVPNLFFLLDLLENLEFPIAATSVNISGEKPALSFEEISSEILKNSNVISKEYEEFKNFHFSGIPSSIFDLSCEKKEEIKCIREGKISLKNIFDEII